MTMSQSEQQENLELDTEQPLDEPESWRRDDPDEEVATAMDTAPETGEEYEPSSTAGPEQEAVHIENPD